MKAMYYINKNENNAFLIIEKNTAIQQCISLINGSNVLHEQMKTFFFNNQVVFAFSHCTLVSKSSR